MSKSIFEPFQLGSSTLKNRVSQLRAGLTTIKEQALALLLLNLLQSLNKALSTGIYNEDQSKIWKNLLVAFDVPFLATLFT